MRFLIPGVEVGPCYHHFTGEGARFKVDTVWFRALSSRKSHISGHAREQRKERDNENKLVCMPSFQVLRNFLLQE